jgi:hypothetical protein
LHEDLKAVPGILEGLYEEKAGAKSFIFLMLELEKL